MRADPTPYVGEIIKETTLQLCQALAERDAAISERDQARAAVEVLTKQIADLSNPSSNFQDIS